MLIKTNEYSIRILDKKRSTAFPHLSVICDVRDRSSLQRAIRSESIIIHLAAEHADNVRPIRLYYDVNVGGMKNICEIASEKSCHKIVFTSSVAVYGLGSVNTNEDAPLQPTGDYGASKRDAEKILRDWVLQKRKEHNRACVIVRPTVVFGAGNRGNVFRLLKAIARRRFIMIGSGNNRKSIAYVENIAAFIAQCATESMQHDVYNYVDYPDLTMNQLIQVVRRALKLPYRHDIAVPTRLAIAIAKICDKCVGRISAPRAVLAARISKFVTDSMFPADRAHREFKAQRPLIEALEQTVEYEFGRNLPQKRKY